MTFLTILIAIILGIFAEVVFNPRIDVDKFTNEIYLWYGIRNRKYIILNK